MINRINTLDSSKKISFKAKPLIPAGPQLASVAGKGLIMQQVNSMKGVCKEILLRIGNDNSLIAKTAAVLGTIKLTQTAITFLASENDGIRLSMPRGPQGELFKMQLIKDTKPESSIVLDSFGKVVESYGRESIEYAKARDIDLDMIQAIVTGIYNSVDEPLFNVRMFMRKFGQSNNITANKLDNIQMPNIENIIAQQKAAVTKVEPRKQMPPAHIIKNLPIKGSESKFSYKAVIDQYATIQPAAERIKKRSRKLSTAEKSVLATQKAEKKKITRTKAIAGVVSQDIQAKIIKSLELYEQISGELKNVSPMTAQNIRKAYGIEKGNDRKLSFSDISIISKTGKNYENQRALSVVDNETGDSIKVLDSGRVLKNIKDLSQLPSARYFHYLSQSEIDDSQQIQKLNQLLDKTIARLEDFKLFLDKKSWRKLHNRVLENETAKVDELNIERLGEIKEKFISIKERFKKLGSTKSAILRREFGIVSSKSSRLEFTNPLNDGNNYAFNYVTKKAGEFYIIEQIKDGKTEELLAITPEGKILKNTSVLLGAPVKKKFYTDEEFNANGLSQKVEQCINILDEKIRSFESFIEEQTSPKPRGRKAVIREAKESLATHSEGMISVKTIQKFLDKTVADIQSSADRLRELTGFNSMLDSVAEKLRKSFDEFIQNIRKD